MKTDEYWAGQGGNAYHARNRVDWKRRIPFWSEVIESTGARSVYEHGCGPGWNLSAIRQVDPTIEVYGSELNQAAEDQAQLAGVQMVMPLTRGFDLVCTVGMLIHVPPDDLQRTMRSLAERSADWVLAVEYEDDEETGVEYQGQKGLLWRRPYGKLYQDLGLKMVATGGAGDGFDSCTFWLLKR